jgi:hypothetical protein
MPHIPDTLETLTKERDEARKIAIGLFDALARMCQVCEANDIAILLDVQKWWRMHKEAKRILNANI